MTQKRALVTGGNRGIGFAIAKALLAKNYQVIISARSLESAEKASTQLAEKASTQLSDTVIPIELDVTYDGSIQQAVKTIQAGGEALDILINNAGIYPDKGVNILTIPRDLLSLTLNTNTFGPIRMVQACLPLLKKSTDARIVNVSSGYGEISGLSADVPSYCLSKLALNGATIMLAEALASEGIVVNSICPGWVRTDMGGESAPRSPEEGADTAVWLATDASRSESGKFWRDRQVVSF
ncbi:MAG: SDR family NAD(P)-dependent oxidoreductase [Cyanobacteria bacterium J06626_23]